MNNANKLFTFIIFTVIAVTLASCQKDFLNQVPDDRLTIEQVFQRRQQTEEYLANIYNYIRDEAWQWNSTSNPWLGISDEGDITYARSTHPTYYMNIGVWDQSSYYFDFWPHYYNGIRAATYFMQNVGDNEEILRLGGEGQQLITQYTAEARALRAYFYFCLLRQYGPVVILPVDELVAPDATFDNMQFPQSSYDECVDFIKNELDAAAQDLHDWYTGDQHYGRVTRSFVLAVKSRLLLYAASPLFNGNTDYANFRNPDGQQLINQQYDETKWRAAADAAKAVIDLPRFELYKVYSDGELDPFLSYQNLFLEPWNAEVIFARPANALEEWERHCTPRFGGGYSEIGPTQQLVDAYHMANGEIPIHGYNTNGTPIVNAESGYTENGFSTEDGKYTKAGTFNMWVNREPRFYVSIAYNGSEWINTSEGVKIIETFNTGNSGRQGTDNFSRTGYLPRKNVHPNGNPRIAVFTRRPLIYFRLGEIYLNYAEALNEIEPGHPDIAKYVNLIRERAGIPPLPGGLSQPEMRERIRRERRIELAFESLRWFDTQRWKIAEQTNRGPYYGMNVEAGTSLNDPAFYRRTVFETRVFQPKHYLFPIGQHQMDRGLRLVQNPGWER